MKYRTLQNEVGMYSCHIFWNEILVFAFAYIESDAATNISCTVKLFCFMQIRNAEAGCHSKTRHNNSHTCHYIKVAQGALIEII